MNAVLLIENRFDPKPIFEKHPLNWEKMHIKACIDNLKDYNFLMTSYDFWNSLPFEKVLIIQHDSEILSPEPDKDIEQFLEFDYIGAPFNFYPYVGNGGFSLRDVKVMRFITKKYKYKGYPNEDLWFSILLKQEKLNIAKKEEAEKFSTETIFKLGTFGCHAIDRHLTKKQCNEIRNYHRSKKCFA